MLYTIATVLLALWLLGIIVHVGGGLINLLLIAALIAFIYRMVAGKHVDI